MTREDWQNSRTVQELISIRDIRLATRLATQEVCNRSRGDVVKIFKEPEGNVVVKLLTWLAVGRHRRADGFSPGGSGQKYPEDNNRRLSWAPKRREGGRENMLRTLS